MPAALIAGAVLDLQGRVDREMDAFKEYRLVVVMLTRQFDDAVPSSFWAHLQPAANHVLGTL